MTTANEPSLRTIASMTKASSSCNFLTEPCRRIRDDLQRDKGQLLVDSLGESIDPLNEGRMTA